MTGARRRSVGFGPVRSRRLGRSVLIALGLTLGLTLTLALACEPLASPEVASPRCAAGERRDCHCLDGAPGTQPCAPEGLFQPCECGAGDAQPASGGAAGEPGSGGAGRFDGRDPGAPGGPEHPAADAFLGGEPPGAGADARTDEPVDGCARPLATRIDGFDIFTYEASHPTATAFAAFPGALSTGLGPRAPGAQISPCSRPGVRPWHTISFPEASEACVRIGWRLCRESELIRACEGPDGRDWTWGTEFDGSVCNLRQVYLAPGAETSSEAPSGEFGACVSEEGCHDLSGNVWEWTDNETRYVGAGWRIVAERHHEADLVCTARGLAGPGFASADVGFRCCRDAR